MVNPTRDEAKAMIQKAGGKVNLANRVRGIRREGDHCQDGGKDKAHALGLARHRTSAKGRSAGPRSNGSLRCGASTAHCTASLLSLASVPRETRRRALQEAPSTAQ